MIPRLSNGLLVYRNPLRMVVSGSPWAATLYLFSYVPVGTVLFVVAFSVVVTTYALSILSLGILLLIGAAGVVRGCAEIERRRTGLVGAPIRSEYLPVTESGILARIKLRWTDPAILRDCAYLLLMFVPLVVVDAAALTVWLACLTGVTLPLWYRWSPQTWHDGEFGHGVKLGYFPAGPHAPDGVGLWVGNLPTALLGMVVFAVLALPAAYVVVGAARMHAAVARSLLGPYVDPLAPAKRMLAEPGPLA